MSATPVFTIGPEERGVASNFLFSGRRSRGGRIDRKAADGGDPADPGHLGTISYSERPSHVRGGRKEKNLSPDGGSHGWRKHWLNFWKTFSLNSEIILEATHSLRPQDK